MDQSDFTNLYRTLLKSFDLDCKAMKGPGNAFADQALEAKIDAVAD